VQYRLLYWLLWTCAASLWKNPSCDSRLCRYSPPISKCLQDHVLYLARFQVASTCVNLTRSQKSHVTYHMTFIDSLTNHVTSHMINPNTWHLTPTFLLWNTDTITTLGRLPNRDIRLTSYLGNTPVWKLQNQDDWKTRWPDRDTPYCIAIRRQGFNNRLQTKKPPQHGIAKWCRQGCRWGRSCESLQGGNLELNNKGP